MKDEREILTRELIRQKLTHEAKRVMLTSLFTLIFGSLFIGLVYFMLLMAFSSNPALPKIITAITFTALALCCAFLTVRGALQLGKIRRGEFTVLEDVLLEVKEDRINVLRALISGRIFDKDSYEHIFKFKSGKTFVANSGEYRNTRLGASAGFSMPGDVFYTVFYNDAPDKIVWFYSSKTYNCKSADH